MIRIGSWIPVIISLCILFAAAVSDVRSGRIANPLICAGLAAGVLCTTLSLTSFGWVGFTFGILIPFLIFWIPFRMGAIGAGDVKLFLVVGALSGGQNVLYCIFFSLLFAAGISLGRLVHLRLLRSCLIRLFQNFHGIFSPGRIGLSPERDDEGHTIHFAVSILLGYAAWLGVSACRMLLY